MKVEENYFVSVSYRETEKYINWAVMPSFFSLFLFKYEKNEKRKKLPRMIISAP
jgi:hypothetical protein